MTSANLVGWFGAYGDEEQDKGGVTFQRTSVACVRVRVLEGRGYERKLRYFGDVSVLGYGNILSFIHY